MALWIQNVTAGEVSDADLSDYVVRINQHAPMARFQHRRIDGAAACLRAAADAIDANNGKRGGIGGA